MNHFLGGVAGLLLIVGLIGFLLFGILVVRETIKEGGNFKKPGKFVIGAVGLIILANMFSFIADTFYPQDYSQLDFSKYDTVKDEVKGTLTYEDILTTPNYFGFQYGTFTGTVQKIEVIENTSRRQGESKHMTYLLLYVDGSNQKPLKVWWNTDDQVSVEIGESMTIYASYANHQDFVSHNFTLKDIPTVILSSVN